MAVKKLQWDEINDNNTPVEDYNLNELFEPELNTSEYKDNDKFNKKCKVSTENIIEKRNILIC